MKITKTKKNYFLKSSEDYFNKYKKNRLSFLKRKQKFFYEISFFFK